jgi:hypothetical protein
VVMCNRAKVYIYSSPVTHNHQALVDWQSYGNVKVCLNNSTPDVTGT